MSINSVYFLGLGALGAKYAASFYDYKPEMVKVIVDSNRKLRYQAESVFVNEKEYNFDYITSGDSFITPDYIFLVVKSSHLVQAIEDLKPFVGENTKIISLMNGISSERVLADDFGWDKVINAVAYMDAVKIGNNVTYGSIGKIIFGHVENKFQNELKDLNQLMLDASIPNELSQEIQKAQWAKYLINVVANQLSFLLEFPYKEFATNEYVLNLMNLVADEVISVGNALGIEIGEVEINRMKSTLTKVDGEAKTSMFQDREAKRFSEVDEFSGEIIKLGKEVGVKTPYNELIFNMVKAIEKTY